MGAIFAPPRYYGEFWDLDLDLNLGRANKFDKQNPFFFGSKFVVKYWHAKHENRNCCPQHGAFNAMSAGLAFSVVTIAVSEPFLLPIAENWSPGWRYVLAPIS